MSWTTSLVDLRTVLSDLPTDKIRWRQKCFGVSDDSNKTYKTFEKRRISPLVSPTAPAGVFVNDTIATVTSEDLASGEFTLSSAPSNGDRVEATYYTQWWTDTQLAVYLKSATQFLGLGTDYTAIPDGLQPAAIKYAAADAYQELSIRFSELVSQQFRAEDMPGEAMKNTLDGFRKLAGDYRKEAMLLRKGYYTREDEPESAFSSSICGHVHEVEPNA